MHESIDQNPFRNVLKGAFFSRVIERLLGLDRLADIYAKRPFGASPLDFLKHVLDSLNVTLEVSDQRETIKKIPAKGSLLVVANHPLGGLEGVAIASFLLRHRPDTKVLTNALLTKIPELQSIFIGVDILSSQRSRGNTAGIREARAHLASGGVLLLFPAGKVATFNFSQRKVSDYPWNRFAGRLVRKTGATVLPLYVDAYNSRMFYMLALMHRFLRTAMLPRELANKGSQTLRVVTGELISAKEFQYMETDERVTACLRLATELLQLKQRGKIIHSPKAFAQLPLSTVDALPSSGSDLLQQLMTMEDCQVVCNEAYAVYIAPFDRLGVVMDAIGQAREYTFREAGEGTGNSSDVDQFDPYYLHVFVWDKHRLRIVGGYRLGRVHEIVARCGIDGLYARTLYSLDLEYLKKLGNPLELGRSFVHPDYQRKPAALDLLWRGIGRYVASHPEFDTLFGAVSISNEHSDMARALISECMLESFQAEQKFLNNVEPVAPLSVSDKVWSREMLATLSHVPLVNKLIGCCDPGKALPILLRHYLSLNGKFVCFSVNKAFNDSLDGLILVDLSKVPEKYMKRYLGAEGLEHYQKHWKIQVQAGNDCA